LNGKSEPFFVGELTSKDSETLKCSIKIMKDKFPCTEKEYLKKKNAKGEQEIEAVLDNVHQYSFDSE
jgi:hypothetical protein